MTSAFLFTAALAFPGAALAHTNHDPASPLAAAAGDAKSGKKDSGKDSAKSAKKSDKKSKDSKQAK
ncbi:MAG TPA: hypothetical protein VFS67_05010 [Polyangiaceae bacterium]|nr:hypothetical protein [Polyangiaceae bacterium]